MSQTTQSLPSPSVATIDHAIKPKAEGAKGAVSAPPQRVLPFYQRNDGRPCLKLVPPSAPFPPSDPPRARLPDRTLKQPYARSSQSRRSKFTKSVFKPQAAWAGSLQGAYARGRAAVLATDQHRSRSRECLKWPLGTPACRCVCISL